MERYLRSPHGTSVSAPGCDTLPRHRSGLRATWCRLAGVWSVVGAWIVLAVCAAPVLAVPHIMSPGPHPYDPDWPEIYLILATKCGGCHNATSKHSDYSTYERLMAAETNEGKVVVPGDIDESLLYQFTCWNAKFEEDSYLPRRPEMPHDELEWLTDGQQEAIIRWIERGALEYKLPDHCKPYPLNELDFPSAKQCAACHPKQYEEWSRSMHAYAQQSPVFEAFNLTLIERTGGTIGTFCTRCHTNIGTALGENGSRRNVHRSRLSLESVTCVTCHRQNRAQYKSNSRIFMKPGKLLDQCMFGPFGDPVGGEEIGTHPSAGRPYIKTSQFCGECHDVTNPQGIRLEEAFSEWQNSPSAKEQITCQQCHMGPVAGVAIPDNQRPLGRAARVPGVDPKTIPLRHLTDHTFAGPDYSLLPDTEFPYKLDWMYECDYRDEENLTPHQLRTLDELRRRNRAQLAAADNKRYELLQNAARLSLSAPRTARSGSLVRLRVDVTSLFGGHNFPTGFSAERQAWVSLVVRNPAGRVVYTSGDLDENRDLRDEHSHAVLSGEVRHDRHLLNFQNKFIALANKGTERSVVLSVNRDLRPLNVLRPAPVPSASHGRPPTFRIAKGSLPPLGTMGQTYPVRLPGNCVGEYTVAASLNFRNLPPTLLDHIGTPHLKHLLEIVVIDSRSATIRVTP